MALQSFDENFHFFIFARLLTDVTELKYNSAPNFSSVILVQPSNQATILLLFSHWEMYIQTFLLLFRSPGDTKKVETERPKKCPKQLLDLEC